MACQRIRFREVIAAKLALAKVTRQDKSWRPKRERRVYRCAMCGGWLLTSQGRGR
jgi:hypothetical protein